MKCPYCDKDMTKGGVQCVSVPTPGPIVVSFTAEEDKDKGLLKRDTKVVNYVGRELKAYCCSDCDTIVTIFE